MNKKNTYTQLLPQIAAMIEGETCETSVLANVAAALHQAFDQFFWTGFYMLHPDGMLRLGPFQGPPACYAIAIGKGVCVAKPLRQRAHWLFPTWNSFLDTLLAALFRGRKS